MSSEWDHVAFREYVIGHARNAQVARDQASLAKVTGIDTGLLGRYFRGETQPGPANLQKIHRVIPGTSMSELLVLAGRAPAAAFQLQEPPSAPQGVNPRAEHVDWLLGDESPIDEDERQMLDNHLGRLLSTYPPLPGTRRRTG